MGKMCGQSPQQLKLYTLILVAQVMVVILLNMGGRAHRYQAMVGIGSTAEFYMV